MSSGVEADIALDAAVVLSLGMNRLLGGAAGLAAGGAGALAAFAQGRVEAGEEALREAARYDEEIRAVLDLNARIAVLHESRRRAAEEHGIAMDVALPEPLVLSDQSAEELAAWCAETGSRLGEAENGVSAAIATAVAGQIFAVRPEALRSALSAAERHLENETRFDRGALAETLTRVLGRALPDTGEADHAYIAEAAERLASASTAAEAEGLLTEVRLRVQRVNEWSLRARAEARRLAEEQRAREQAEAERHYVLDTITTAFEAMGYAVDTGFETMQAQDGAVILTRGDWPEHAVKMRIEPDADPAHGGAVDDTAGRATLRAAMLRDGPPRSEEERRIDVEREREWCDAFEEARTRLAARGLRSDVRWRIEPGEQRLPIANEAERSRSRTLQQRERQRERPR
jgi:hypothetical protein